MSLAMVRCALAAIACSVLLSACTPQSALLASLMPDGTFNVLMGNLEHVADENRKRVSELERRGDWDELVRFAEQNIAKDTSNADWWVVAGYAHSQLKRYSAAADAYRNAVRLEPDSPEAWNLLAQSYRAGGDTQRALNTLNNALVALRDSPLTYFLLGETYSDLQRYEEAAAAYREALKIESRFPQGWYGLARSYAQSGRAGEAKAAATRLEQLDAQLARRLRESGDMEIRRGR